MKKFRLFVFILIALAITTKEAKAIPALNPSNGNWYDYISYTSDWFGASANAQTRSFNGMAGNLVTLTSAEENTWVVNNVSNLSGWLGGFQPAGSPEPAGNWQWVTGEAWNYTNWAAGEPNNQGNENFLIFMNVSQWNDWSNNITSGYIIEYEGINSVPEPSTTVLIGSGIIVLVGIEIRRKLKKTKTKKPYHTDIYTIR